MTQKDRPSLLLVTGPSGAGRTTAIRALEDIGYEVIDNLPLSLLPRLVEGVAPTRPLAIGLDVRNRDFDVDRIVELLGEFSTTDALGAQLVYLDCSEDVLIRRYSETRRRHPLAESESPLEGIRRELALLRPLRRRADVLIDTTESSVHDTRAEIERYFAPGEGRPLAIQVHSFSYKRGLPRELDMVFDVRFLRNPHWKAALRPKTGRDAEVAAYISKDPLYGPFFAQVADLIRLLLPAYQREGKSYLSIGFGCTGGKHRSVALAEALVRTLEAEGWPATLRHRELDRGAA